MTKKDTKIDQKTTEWKIRVDNAEGHLEWLKKTYKPKFIPRFDVLGEEYDLGKLWLDDNNNLPSLITG